MLQHMYRGVNSAGQILDGERASTYLPILSNFLAKVVARRKKAKFRMHKFASASALGLERNECSTSGCAAGWGTLLFHEEGFKLKKSVNVIGDYLPKFKGETGFEACAAFFGIDYCSALWLFGAGSYEVSHVDDITAKAVADRINEFCAEAELA